MLITIRWYKEVDVVLSIDEVDSKEYLKQLKFNVILIQSFHNNDSDKWTCRGSQLRVKKKFRLFTGDSNDFC